MSRQAELVLRPPPSEAEQVYEAVLSLRARCVARFSAMPAGVPRSLSDLTVLLCLCWVARTAVGVSDESTAAEVALVSCGLPKPTFTSAGGLALAQLVAATEGDVEVAALFERRVRAVGGGEGKMAQVEARCGALWDQVQQLRDDLRAEGLAVGVQLESLLPSTLSLDIHQLEAVAFFRRTDWRGLLGDEMGLGKTISTLGAVLASGCSSALVVCPVSMFYVWEGEAQKWLSHAGWSVVPVEHSGPPLRLRPKTVYLASWSLLSLNARRLGFWRGGLLVADESQALAHMDSTRTRIFFQLRGGAKGCLCLSGTYSPNGLPAELWPQLRAVAREEAPAQRPFLKQFGGPRTIFLPGKTPRGTQRMATRYDGRSNEVDLALLTRRWILRRTKDQFEEGYLPPKAIYRIPVPLSSADLTRMDEAKDRVRAQILRRVAEEEARMRDEGKTEAAIEARLRSLRSVEILVQSGALRKAVGLSKARWAPSFLTSLVEEGRRPVVFTYHLEVARTLIQNLRGSLGEFEVRSGLVSSAEARRDLVRSWETGEGKVLVLTRRFSTGVTLVSGCDLLMLERFLVPAEEDQSEARVHRRGQTKDTRIFYAECRGTVDDVGEDRIARKRRSTSVMQGNWIARAWTWLQGEDRGSEVDLDLSIGAHEGDEVGGEE